MRETYLERRFFNSFLDAFRKYVSSILLSEKPENIPFNWDGIKAEFKREMTKRSQNHISGILLLGLFEGREEPRGVKIPWFEFNNI